MYEYPPGSTALDSDEAMGLMPSHIKTQRELNEWEQNNILSAEKWAFARKPTNILNIEFVKLLHKKMFGKTWKWSGSFRRCNKNIGVDWPLITNDLGICLKEVEYQMNHNIYPMREIAARFHHKLVFIHCFANGNGRHARLMTDIFLKWQRQQFFSWGKGDLYYNGDIRQDYLKALRKADNHDYELLIEFVDR